MAWGAIGHPDNPTNAWDWEDARRYYESGDKDRAYVALGHVLRLLTNMAMPRYALRNQDRAFETAVLDAMTANGKTLPPEYWYSIPGPALAPTPRARFETLAKAAARAEASRLETRAPRAVGLPTTDAGGGDGALAAAKTTFPLAIAQAAGLLSDFHYFMRRAAYVQAPGHGDGNGNGGPQTVQLSSGTDSKSMMDATGGKETVQRIKSYARPIPTDCRLENVRAMNTYEVSAWWPIWTPDSRSVLFTDFNSPPDKIDPLYLVDITTGKSKLLASEVDITAGVGFSPTGESLSLRNSWRAKTKDRKRRQIVDLKTGKPHPDSDNQSEAWVPSKESREREGRKKFPIYLISNDGGKKFFLRNSDFYFQEGMGMENHLGLTLPGKLLSADWLPDGAALIADVATMDVTPEGHVEASELYLVIPESQKVIQLTHSAAIVEYSPKVSPNGKHVAFLDQRLRRNETNSLYIGDVICR